MSDRAKFKAKTFTRKRNALDRAIRSHGTPDVQDAWDAFYGYTDCIPLCADTAPQSEVDAVREENMRLREALDGVVSEYELQSWGPVNYAMEAARAALKGDQDDI